MDLHVLTHSFPTRRSSDLDSGVPVEELHPRHRLVGHFDDEDMPPPASILMPGYHGANIRNVSIRMMVDELLGACHHTLFVVEFVPSRSEEHTSELQSLMRISYAVFCLNKTTNTTLN